MWWFINSGIQCDPRKQRGHNDRRWKQANKAWSARRKFCLPRPAIVVEMGIILATESHRKYGGVRLSDHATSQAKFDIYVPSTCQDLGSPTKRFTNGPWSWDYWSAVMISYILLQRKFFASSRPLFHPKHAIEKRNLYEKRNVKSGEVPVENSLGYTTLPRAYSN